MKSLFVFILCAIFASGCAFKKKAGEEPQGISTASPSQSKIEPKARNQFFTAERHFFNKDYDAALRGYQQLRVKFPKGKSAQLSSYRIGSIYYYQEQYAQASKEFESHLATYPQSELTLDVTYNLAASEYQQGRYERAQQVLAKMKPADIQAQGPRRGEIIYQLKAQIAESLNNPSQAIVAYATKAQLPISEGERERIHEQVQKNLVKMSDTGELERLRNEITEPGTKNFISQRITVLTTPVKTTASEESLSGQIATTSTSSGDRMSVGVVLPLTGRFAPYGKKALEGILFGARLFQASNQSGIELHVKDSKSNAAVAGAAVDELHDSHNVMAVIGPLSFSESMSVAERAGALGIVNLSLSAKEGISERNQYLFQNALTPHIQLESLLQYCVTNRELKRFAILAPDSAFGRDMTNEFWELAERSGAKITAFASYPPEEKDFQSQIKELVGLRPEYRGFELGKLAEFAKEQKLKTGKEPKTKLVPIVDFDAIFIPDSPKSVGAIAASLAFFDVSVPLLGTTEWNNDQLYRRGGRYVAGALFPGGLSASNPNQKEFIRSYIEAYGTAPDLLAVQAFEAVQLLQYSLAQNGSSSRGDLANTISALRNFSSPLGAISFDANRVARRKIPIYTLEANGGISQVQ